MRVIIKNKPTLRDPEGETILRDLVRRHEYNTVSEVRTAQVLEFKIDGSTPKDACASVSELCTKLRIYNPLVSEITIDAYEP